MYQRLVLVDTFIGLDPPSAWTICSFMDPLTTLGADPQKESHAQPHDLVRRQEENRSQRHHHKHHDGRDDGLAPAWPSDLLGFRPHLLQELERVELRHDLCRHLKRRRGRSPIYSMTPERCSPPKLVLLGPVLAGVEGLEPPTPGFGDRCSSH